jgi:PIN domain nuclease of toxin-antitoxin system
LKILLDTHVLLWWLAGDTAIPRNASDAIADSDSEVFVSAATAWEIAIKKAAGRLETPDDLLEALGANDFGTLPITAPHALAAGNLPAHHSDPFDRMLIAQAQLERLILVSADRRFSEYEVELFPFG